MVIQYFVKDVFMIAGIFTPAECEQLIKQSERSGYEVASIMTEKGAKVITDVRNNQRLIYKDEELAKKIWKRISDLVPEQIGNSKAVGLNELFRFYKYEPGQKFKRHVDESFIRDEREASYYTLLIYLNDDFEGGETDFDEVSVKSEKGVALVFLHSIPHEGVEVKSGVKYVLRTDIMYRLKDE